MTYIYVEFPIVNLPVLSGPLCILYPNANGILGSIISVVWDCLTIQFFLNQHWIWVAIVYLINYHDYVKTIILSLLKKL